MYLRSPKRSGATVVESAVVYPTTFLLLLSLVIGAMGVFRYQEVASLARAAARYASTHGAEYRKDAGMGVGSPGTSAGSSNNTFWFSADLASTNGSDTSTPTTSPSSLTSAASCRVVSPKPQPMSRTRSPARGGWVAIATSLWRPNPLRRETSRSPTSH